MTPPCPIADDKASRPAFSDLSGWARKTVGMRSSIASRFILSVIVFAIATLSLVGDADARRKRKGRDDHDDAQRYYENGRTLPLERILQIARGAVGGGEVVDVEFKVKKGRPVCEVKIIDRTGRMREVYVDAETGQVLKLENG